MKDWLFPPEFENRMTRTETVLGWLYLPIHIAILPLLLGVYALVSPAGLTEAAINLIYYGVGTVFVLCAMFRFLRGGFDIFMDDFGRCFSSAAAGLPALYALSILVTVLFMAFGLETDANPNNLEIADLAGTDYGVTKAMALFLAPLVEEALFRGVVFGTIRPHSRLWAYIVSVLMFGLYHVWQYAIAAADPLQLIYVLQYVPHGLVLAWCYDRSGSIWTPVFLHMGVNAIAFLALGL